MKGRATVLRCALLAALLALLFLAGLSAGHDFRVHSALFQVESAIRLDTAWLKVCRKRVGDCAGSFTEKALARNELNLRRYAEFERLGDAGLRGFLVMDEALAATYPGIDFDGSPDYEGILARYEKAGLDIGEGRGMLDEIRSDATLSALQILDLLFTTIVFVVGLPYVASFTLACVWHMLEKAHRARKQAVG